LKNLKIRVLDTPVKVEIRFFAQGYYKSRFQNLAEALSFDKSYSFDLENNTVSYNVQSQLEVKQRFVVLDYMFSGMK